MTEIKESDRKFVGVLSETIRETIRATQASPLQRVIVGVLTTVLGTAILAGGTVFYNRMTERLSVMDSGLTDLDRKGRAQEATNADSIAELKARNETLVAEIRELRKFSRGHGTVINHLQKTVESIDARKARPDAATTRALKTTIPLKPMIAPIRPKSLEAHRVEYLKRLELEKVRVGVLQTKP